MTMPQKRVNMGTSRSLADYGNLELDTLLRFSSVSPSDTSWTLTHTDPDSDANTALDPRIG